jgi:hypothetical protein
MAVDLRIEKITLDQNNPLSLHVIPIEAERSATSLIQALGFRLKQK